MNILVGQKLRMASSVLSVPVSYNGSQKIRALVRDGRQPERQAFGAKT